MMGEKNWGFTLGVVDCGRFEGVFSKTPIYNIFLYILYKKKGVNPPQSTTDKNFRGKQLSPI